MNYSDFQIQSYCDNIFNELKIHLPLKRVKVMANNGSLGCFDMALMST